ncbi:MAG TPA: class GN sortase, partial [Nitrospira sp.]|nr:class GN sortase [Nitrospira sp.]
MSRTRPGSRLLALLIAGLLAIGCWQVGDGSWIYAKARLAQFLLQRAWCRALAGEAMPKPWPWADTWPVARLRMQHPSVDLIVLAGAYGRTLAFGPGHVTSSALPGQKGTVMLTGHRDTHFRFLKDVKLGDYLALTGSDGTTLHYRVVEQRVMDSRREFVPAGQDTEDLVLVTCFPFDAIQAGGPLRYVVRAERIAMAPIHRQSRPPFLARIIHECRREAFETEARRGFSHVRPTQAYLQSVEEAEREQPRRARGSD